MPQNTLPETARVGGAVTVIRTWGCARCGASFRTLQHFSPQRDIVLQPIERADCVKCDGATVTIETPDPRTGLPFTPPAPAGLKRHLQRTSRRAPVLETAADEVAAQAKPQE